MRHRHRTFRNFPAAWQLQAADADWRGVAGGGAPPCLFYLLPNVPVADDKPALRRQRIQAHWPVRVQLRC